jgi:hypothetical protein
VSRIEHVDFVRVVVEFESPVLEPPDGDIVVAVAVMAMMTAPVPANVSAARPVKAEDPVAARVIVCRVIPVVPATGLYRRAL